MTTPKPRPSIVHGESHFYPVLPLRDIVVFPHMIVPLFVGREKSIRALEEVMKNDALIMLATQKNASDDDPSPDSIYETGTLASVLQLLKLPDGTVKVLVEGLERARIEKYSDRAEYYEATAVALADTDAASVEAEALARSVVSDFESYVKLNKKISAEVVGVVQAITDFAKLGDAVASHLAVKIADRQAILETLSVTARLEKVLGLMESEISVLQVEKRIRSRVKRQMEKTQREYYLNEQMKAIQKELGDDEGRDELADLEEKIAKTKLSKEAREKAQLLQLVLRQMSPMSAEATVVRNYLDWLLSIPWNKKSKVKKDLVAAQTVLDNDHYGLEKVKDRIVEYLAVQSRANKLTGPILCLVGPPGVGKTSLGKSIAKATGREFVRVSLGGVRDEAEIRGHRRTYIGSMPGKIIQSMRKAKTSNPLFLLDEIDKMGADFRGDPSSALLEVLDPEQNSTFNDHYLQVDHDLSHVMFVTTANTLRIPQPLMDRMEIIRIPGYTEDESEDLVGCTTGLAWTEVGGELLTIEAVTVPGKGRVTATCKLGDVMKESVQAAESYVKSRSYAFGITPSTFEKKDIHVHVPEGATPKDGPSAGVAMVTSIVSVLTGIPVRRDIAMTGEITLRGRVLPIGGLKEKLLAALRGGLKTVLIPKENEKDLAEIPDNVKRGLKIIPVKTVDELLGQALAAPLTPIAWSEDGDPEPVVPAQKEERSGVVTH